MTFYHFTHPGHVPSILRERVLRPTESNVGSPFPVTDGPMGEGVAPDVVWLLDTPDVGGSMTDPTDTTHGLYAAKRAIRFEVDVPAIRWLDWAPAVEMSHEWRTIMVDHAGGMEMAERWHVFPAPIRSRRWVGAVDLVNGNPIEF